MEDKSLKIPQEEINNGKETDENEEDFKNKVDTDLKIRKYAVDLCCGVPQGSIFVPVLFIL
jgi:hypothetical protein